MDVSKRWRVTLNCEDAVRSIGALPLIGHN
jgi:hypothetical protein